MNAPPRKKLLPEDLGRFNFDADTLDLFDAETVAERGALPLRYDPKAKALALGVSEDAKEDAVNYVRILYGVTSIEVWEVDHALFQKILRRWFLPYWSLKGMRVPSSLIDSEKIRLSPRGEVVIPAAKRDRNGGFTGANPEATQRIERPGRKPPPAAPRGLAVERGSATECLAAGYRKPPVVVIIEKDAGMRAHLTAILEHSGIYAVAVEDRKGLELALRVHDVSMAVLARGCEVEPLDARELLDAAGRFEAEVRVIHDYGAGLFGDLVEYERMLAFVIDLVEQIERAIVAATGGREGRARRAGRQAKLVAERMRQPRRVVDAAFLAAMLVELDPALGRLRARTVEGAPDLSLAGSSGIMSALLERANAPLGLQNVLAAVSMQPRSCTADPMPARIVRAVREYSAAVEAGDVAGAETSLRARAGVDLDPDVVEVLLAVAASDREIEKLGPERPEVVLVDANPDATTLLELRLANRGYAVRTFRDGKRALAAIQARAPALIVADVAVPAMDGYTLLLKVRANQALRATPFVFLTDRSDPASVTKAIELGADDFFQKPVNPDIFFAKVQALVAKAQARSVPSQGIQGRLEEMPLPDLLQVLAGSGRTVKIDIDGMDRRATLQMVEGKLVHASTARNEGTEAALDVLLWEKGRFEISSDRTEFERNVTEPLDFLLIEAARRKDESEREGKG